VDYLVQAGNNKGILTAQDLSGRKSRYQEGQEEQQRIYENFWHNGY